MRYRSLLSAALLLAALPSDAGLLTGQGTAVLDSTNAQRASFSTNETIGFQQIVNNGVDSPNRIQFEFTVQAPNGNIVFRHRGNSVRGTVGNAASQIAGLPISGFAQGPGVYTLKATAALDGIALEQTMTFTISSPNILLIYPPNGSQNLSDNPLSFQWYSSGAVTYRVTVGDNASMYNALFIQTTSPGASSLAYPQNPTDARQRLSTGQTYWWKVEGLDVNGNVVAQSQAPFSFSVANTALTRDLAVTGLDITGPPDSGGVIPFLVTIKNQGNTTETNTPLRVTLGGLSAGDPISVPQMSPTDVQTFSVSAAMPPDQNQSLTIACLTLFDDNVANNCKTLSVTRAAALSSGTFAGDSGALSGEQIWQAIQQLLRDQGTDLSGYSYTDMEGSLSQADLAALLDQLRQGQARASLSGPALEGALASVPTPATLSAVDPDQTGAPPRPPEEPVEQPKTVVQERTWSGNASALAAKPLFFSINQEGVWRRLWQKTSDEPVPQVNFAEHTVVGIVAGSQSNIDRVIIEEFSSMSSVLTVRYRLVTYARPFDVQGSRTAAPKKKVPYLFVAIPRTALKVKFEKIKENSNE